MDTNDNHRAERDNNCIKYSRNPEIPWNYGIFSMTEK